LVWHGVAKKVPREGPPERQNCGPKADVHQGQDVLLPFDHDRPFCLGTADGRVVHAPVVLYVRPRTPVTSVVS